MFSLLSFLRNNKSKKSIHDKTAHMNPSVRTELTHEVVVAVHEVSEIDRDLDTARLQLEKAMESEAFVGNENRKICCLVAGEEKSIAVAST